MTYYEQRNDQEKMLEERVLDFFIIASNYQFIGKIIQLKSLFHIQKTSFFWYHSDKFRFYNSYFIFISPFFNPFKDPFQRGFSVINQIYRYLSPLLTFKRQP